MWNFKQASRRNDASIAWDVMFSAVMYGEVAAQVVYLPYQEKILKAMGKNGGRVKASRRFGDYAVIVHHPSKIFPVWGDYGLEGVLSVRVQTGTEFMNTWGNLASKVADDIQDYSYVTSFDYVDYEKRCVWGVPSDNSELTVSGEGATILEQENELGFIPYAIRRWGNSLSLNSDERVTPFLQSVYTSKQWDILNVLGSIDASLTIRRASRPEYAGEFPEGRDPEIDNTEPTAALRVPQGTRNFTTLPAQPMDGRVNSAKSEYQSKIWQSTVSKVLQSLEFPSGTAYSSQNQVLSMATKSLAPYKILGQNALSDIAHQMLCWTKYYGEKYDKNTTLYGQYDDKSRAGTEISLAWDTLDPDALQIEVVLTDDIPVDRLQQINGAVLIKNNFRVPEAELLEDLGYSNPSELAKRRNQDDYSNAYIQVDLQKLQMQAQLEMQQAQMQLQAQQQQEMAAQQAQAANNAAPANQNLGGQGFNPAMGGTPPVQGAEGQGL
jgi:hypothetical protein